MIREYIGARYVPRFTGLYDVTQIYEALDVVDNGSGTSYIAKKTVPAGTALTDTDYWFVYGASSGAILDLQTRMSAAEEEILTNTEDILKKQNIKDRIIFIGDSYAVSMADAPTPYPDIVANALGLVANDSYYVSAEGGASWEGVDWRKSFLELLQLIEDDVEDKDSITKIIVCGGVNDNISTLSGIYTGASSFMTYAKATYKNAKVYAGMIGWNTSSATRRNIMTISYPGYMNLGAYGIGVIDNAFMAMHDYRYFASDGTHPTQAGANAIGYMLTSFLISGNAAVDGFGEISTKVTLGSMFTSGNLYFKETKINGSIEVAWTSADLAVASGQTIGYDTLITLGTKESIFWLTDASNQYNSMVPMKARLVYNDGQYQSRPCDLNVINDMGTIKAYVRLDRDYHNIANPIYLSIDAGNHTFNPLCV